MLLKTYNKKTHDLANEQRENRIMFVFYDTETTGLEEEFSQILQIALVFTDSDLNILSSKKLECRRSPWVVPMPGAMLTTGFSPDDLKNNAYSHYEMMREVYAWVESQHWPLTFVGYNTFHFDEGILAQNFYQNLLAPGLTSARNDENGQPNGRADIMAMVKALVQFMPGVLKMDTKTAGGNPSMQLKHVAQQNGVALSEDDAHDAMNDIKATVGLAKLIKKAAPQVWDHMMKLSTETGHKEFLAAHPVFTHTLRNYGKLETTVTTSLAGDGGAQVFFDLSSDPAPYLNMTVDELKAALLKNDKSFLLEQKNEPPILMPMDMSEAVLAMTYDEKLYASRAAALHSNKTFLENVAQAARMVREANAVKVKSIMPELLIDKPVAPEVKARLDQWIQEFHDTAVWKDKVKLIDDFYVRFKADVAADPTLKRFVNFAGRIVYDHAPADLSEEQREKMKKHIASRFLSTEGKTLYVTIAKARKELEQIEKERASGKKWKEVTDGQVRALKLYYTALEKEFAAYAPANDNKQSPPAQQPDLNKKTGNDRPKL